MGQKMFDEVKEAIEASAARKIAEVRGVVYEESKETERKKGSRSP